MTLCYSIVSRFDSSPKDGPQMKFLLGLIVGILIVPAVLYVYLRSGSAPAAATDAPLPFEKILARGSLHARIEREHPNKDVAQFTAPELIQGAEVYQKNCSFCHGLPQQPPSSAAKGMYPSAPQLFTQDGTVTDDPVGETYWKVKNGIRLTGMPSFGGALTEDQMWNVSALVARADKLAPEVLGELKPLPDVTSPVPAMPLAPSVPPAVAPAQHPVVPSPSGATSPAPPSPR
jgi:thiosulfate dehydrogenase